MQLLSVSGEKTRTVFPVGQFFLVVVGECLAKCPNSKKTPLP